MLIKKNLYTKFKINFDINYNSLNPPTLYMYV